MSVPMDFVQRLREALVTILDADADIAAITTRANGNLVPFDDEGEHAIPVLGYRITATTPTGGIGDERKVNITFRAFATTEAVANALCDLVSRKLIWAAFQALATPIDMYRVFSEEGRAPVEPDPETGLCAADVDVCLVATNPTP